MILYVEDNEIVMRAVRSTLKSEGFHLEVCLDGGTALEKIESHKPYELFIFDHELPEITGLNLLLRARRLAHRRRTHIMMFTASECETEARPPGRMHSWRNRLASLNRSKPLDD